MKWVSVVVFSRDANTYLLHRVEGEPAKPPSWWLREVRIVLLYSDVDACGCKQLRKPRQKSGYSANTGCSYDVRYEISELVAAGSGRPTNLFEAYTLQTKGGG